MLQMGIQPEKREQERSDMGESVFPETDPISLFWGLLIYLLLHIGMNTESRGTALWESLVGKPRAKATDPLIHEKGSVTLLLQLGRKANVHAPTPDED